jgi:hypothetical protein
MTRRRLCHAALGTIELFRTACAAFISARDARRLPMILRLIDSRIIERPFSRARRGFRPPAA